jgi:bifunctional DNA-binding transcriptional regulator/antitoxin component of YhaV-PrlF toxin-antitoxin module
MANAILIAMELSIDKFGRFVLPKKLREHLGVGLSLKVEVKETAEGILLKPVRRTSGLMMKDGILIHSGSGENSDHIDWDRLVDDEREEHIRKMAGL